MHLHVGTILCTLYTSEHSGSSGLLSFYFQLQDNTNYKARDSKVITLSRPTALLNPVNILSPFYSINIWRFENLWFLIYLISLLCDKEPYPYISKGLHQENQELTLWVTWKGSEEVKIYSTVVSHSQQLRKFDIIITQLILIQMCNLLSAATYSCSNTLWLCRCRSLNFP